MALVPRSYAPTGPTDAMLDRYVSASALEIAITATMPQIVVTIHVEASIPDLITALDEYMATLGYAPTALDASAKQIFQYAAVGNESASFTINLPAARASANYNVQITIAGGGANALKLVRAIPSSFTTTQFDIELSAPAEAGDVFMITVEDLT